jgi:hypothetical protein
LHIFFFFFYYCGVIDETKANTTQPPSIYLKALKSSGTAAKAAGHGASMGHALTVRLVAHVDSTLLFKSFRGARFDHIAADASIIAL